MYTLLCLEGRSANIAACTQPFNEYYDWYNTTDNLIIPDPTISVLNTYKGNSLQQTASIVTETSLFLSHARCCVF